MPQYLMKLLWLWHSLNLYILVYSVDIHTELSLKKIIVFVWKFKDLEKCASLWTEKNTIKGISNLSSFMFCKEAGGSRMSKKIKTKQKMRTKTLQYGWVSTSLIFIFKSLKGLSKLFQAKFKYLWYVKWILSSPIYHQVIGW